MEITEISNESSQYNQVLDLLQQFDIHCAESIEYVDSSHGEDDIRHNYIIDKKYVLRINSAKVMTEKRLTELNTLIERYRSFGMKAPLFLKAENGSFVVEWDGKNCYLSEYLDFPLAEEVKFRCREELMRQRLVFISRFAQTFKNVDLTETVSMFSIFDLAPYDKLSGLDIDEKQENLNQLVADLTQAGFAELAQKVNAKNDELRQQLKPIYKELPRCVFQGDENFSNLCVDEHDQINGLFDFNMSGTEVIANYLANNAFMGHFCYEDEILDKHTPKEVLQILLDAFHRSTALICEHYCFTEQEFSAYLLYGKIAMISAYWNTSTFGEYLQQEKYKAKIAEIIGLILDEDLS